MGILIYNGKSRKWKLHFPGQKYSGKKCEVNIYIQTGGKRPGIYLQPTFQKFTCKQNFLYITHPSIGQWLLKSKSDYENNFEFDLEAVFFFTNSLLEMGLKSTG